MRLGVITGVAREHAHSVSHSQLGVIIGVIIGVLVLGGLIFMAVGTGPRHPTEEELYAQRAADLEQRLHALQVHELPDLFQRLANLPAEQQDMLEQALDAIENGPEAEG